MSGEFDPWIGKTRTAEDVLAVGPARRMAALLDRPGPWPEEGDALPPGWHWLYFLPEAPQSEIGPDGHAKRGRFLPPVAMPRRMFAGSRMGFHRPARLGARIERTSRIANVEEKRGKAGPLVFVTLEQTWRDADGPVLTDTQTLVYRDAPAPDEAPAPPETPPGDADWRREIAPDPVFLFRYSALTFNGHRIHYDRPYTTEVEGYPGLLVHGPLLATLLLELLHENAPDAAVTAFDFRARRPVFDTGPFLVEGRREGDRALLWARDNDGHLAMRAEAELG